MNQGMNKEIKLFEGLKESHRVVEGVNRKWRKE